MKIIGLSAALLAVGLAAAAVVLMFPPSSLCPTMSDAEVVSLHRGQTRALWLADQIGDTLYQNADLMQRFSHYTAPHPAGSEVVFCPECTEGTTERRKAVVFVATSEPVAELNLEETSEELTESLASHLIMLHVQRATLERTLERMRNP